MSKKQPKYQIKFFYRPGLNLPTEAKEHLQAECRKIAAMCFEEIPNYQCLEQDPHALDDKVITVAQSPDGSIAGFCSAVLLPIEGVGNILHLGLTCVDPSARGHHLTHKLTSKLLTQYLLRYKPIGKLWISNVACVLSSLGNVALNFDNVFPSPLSAPVPDEKHLVIASAISKHHRKIMAISEDARFCPHTFVFQGSVKDTVFQKGESDRQYHHRDKGLNQFYTGLMEFERGDEVLQVGTVSLASLIRYLLRGTVPARITDAMELKLTADMMK